MSITVGFLIFDNMQLLDIAGPYDAFKCVSEIDVHLISETMQPVSTTSNITFHPTDSITTAKQLDVLCIPGGKGVNALLENQPVLDFIRNQSPKARYVTSICTGALVLGVAGLLKNRQATTHWTALNYLEYFGAKPSRERVVVDGKVITAGGVTAGIDFGLTLIAELFDIDTAKMIQLQLQYDPQPPFDCGTPEKAPQTLIDKISQQDKYAQRREAIMRWKQNHNNDDTKIA